jgi:2'-5' RNA ligase
MHNRSTAAFPNAFGAVTAIAALILAGCGGSHLNTHEDGFQGYAMNPHLASNEAPHPPERATPAGHTDDDPGYSIWIMSDESSEQAFYEEIKEISSACRGAAGPFPPHVTLLGRVRGSETEVLEKTRALAERIAPFRMHLLGFGATEERFRQLFIAIERDGSLTAARALAEETFGKTETGEYGPHLSLVYGKLESATKMRIIVAKKGLLDRAFDAKRLAVARTPDALKDWKVIGVFSLGMRREDKGP